MRHYVEGRKRLLPVWHNVTQEEIREHQPALEDIWATNTSEGLRSVVRALAMQIMDATVAVVPADQRPVDRFLRGEGELTLGIEGPAFTLWEALLTFRSEEFPLYVEGEMLNRQRLLEQVADLLASGAPAAEHLKEGELSSIEAMCVAELGFNPMEQRV